MIHNTILPGEAARKQYLELMSEACDADAMLRSSGEAVARYDTVWKTVATRREDATAAIADFLLIASAHIDALEMLGARRPMLATLLSMLVSVDMAKADTAALGALYVDVHVRFFKACLELAATSADDAFVAEHARAILSIEARLFEAAAACHADTDMTLAGLVAAARSIPAPEHINVDPSAPTEVIIDMFSRMNALSYS